MAFEIPAWEATTNGPVLECLTSTDLECEGDRPRISPEGRFHK
jgi:hypothetical protein